MGSSVPLPLADAKIVNGEVVQKTKPTASDLARGKAKPETVEKSQPGQLRVVSTDTNPMRTVVLNKIASGTSPKDFNPAEAEAYAQLSTGDIAAAQQKRLELAGQDAFMQAGMVPTQGNPAKPVADLGTVSAQDPLKFAGSAAPAAPVAKGVAKGIAPAAAPAVAPEGVNLADFVTSQVDQTPTVGGIGAQDAATRQAAMAQLVKAAAPADAPAMPSGKEISKLDGKKIASILANIADAVGAGFAGYAGRNSPTMLQRQAQAQMELQNEIAKADALGGIQARTAGETAKATLPTDIERMKAATDEQVRAKLATLPAEQKSQIEQAIAVARATGDIQRENAIKQYVAELPYELQKIDLQRLNTIMGAMSPTQLAQLRGAK